MASTSAPPDDNAAVASPEGRPAAKRDVFIDFARSIAMLAVVFWHTAWVVSFATTTLKPIYVTSLTWGPWVDFVGGFWVLPTFFFAGAAVMYRPALRPGLRSFYVRRLWRILIPVLFMLGILILVNLVASIIVPDRCGIHGDMDMAGFSCSTAMPLAPLWFVPVYVLFVCLTPLLARIWKQPWGKALLPAGFAVVALCDLMWFTHGEFPMHSPIVGLAVWGIMWCLGFAYAEGRLQKLSRGLLAGIVVGGTALWLLGTLVGSYNPSPQHVPANMVWAVGGVIGIALLLLLRDPIVRFCERNIAGKWIVGSFGPQSYSWYVWHGVAVLIVNTILVNIRFPYPDTIRTGDGEYRIVAGEFWLWFVERPLLIAAPVALTWVFVRLFGWVEDTAPPGFLLGRRPIPAAVSR